MASNNVVLLRELSRAAPLPFDDSDFVELDVTSDSIEDAWFAAPDDSLSTLSALEDEPVAVHPLRTPFVLVAIAAIATLLAISI